MAYWIISPYYLTKDAYFGEKMHCVLVKMAGNHCFSLNSELQSAHFTPPCISILLFYASWQGNRILVLFSWGKKCALQLRLYNDSVSLALYGSVWLATAVSKDVQNIIIFRKRDILKLLTVRNIKVHVKSFQCKKIRLSYPEILCLMWLSVSSPLQFDPPQLFYVQI